NGPTGENGIPDFGNEIIGPYCLTTGELYDLVWVDWYGDGGLAFDVIQDGILTNMYIGGGAGNTWTFEAGASTLPAYDSPCGATEILPDINTATFITSQCIASFSEIRPPAGSCATYGMWCENGISNSAWAYFIAEEGKAYEISACNSGSSFDTQIAVWHGSDCIDPWSFELVTANDDGWNGCGEANGYTSTCYASCLEPGDVYYIQVDGWNGENGTAVISVNSYLGDEILSAQVNDINCPLNKGQAPNGSIFPSIVGTGADFECYWEGPDGFESDDHFVYNLGPGEYQLTATTNCGTVYEGTYSIGLPDQWNVTTSVTPSSCPDAEDGSIEIIASGATPGYSYAINGPNGYSSNSSFVDNAYLGNYNVTVTDANGCTFTQTVSVSTEDDLSFDLGPDTTLC
ncbi:MAG: SprB repeat-containing protein, partial [Flavobacteriales bacterium]|nr:SprB repeat-containing protein [Flavobacteriales bacterium]